MIMTIMCNNPFFNRSIFYYTVYIDIFLAECTFLIFLFYFYYSCLYIGFLSTHFLRLLNGSSCNASNFPLGINKVFLILILILINVIFLVWFGYYSNYYRNIMVHVNTASEESVLCMTNTRQSDETCQTGNTTNLIHCLNKIISLSMQKVRYDNSKLVLRVDTQWCFFYCLFILIRLSATIFTNVQECTKICSCCQPELWFFLFL